MQNQATWNSCTIFFNKIPKLSSEKHETMISRVPDTCWWYKTFCYMIFIIANINYNEHQNSTHNMTRNLQSSFDSILIVFYNIMVCSVIFDSSLIQMFLIFKVSSQYQLFISMTLTMISGHLVLMLRVIIIII